jgi:hypothetical protein
MTNIPIGDDSDRESDLRVAVRETIILALWFGSLFGLLVIAHGVLG